MSTAALIALAVSGIGLLLVLVVAVIGITLAHFKITAKLGGLSSGWQTARRLEKRETCLYSHSCSAREGASPFINNLYCPATHDPLGRKS